MALTTEQIAALAPDAKAFAAGRKLATPAVWQSLGSTDVVVWGECRGSALYQVRADLRDFTVSCSCPSRKFPCKHGLGLLLLAASGVVSPSDAEPPEWVSAWLAKRAARAEKQLSETPKNVSRTRDKTERVDERHARVLAGLDGLDLWLADLVRGGLASVETQPASFWEAQAARMVDAQAPGIAARLRRMATLPLATPDWPQRLLAELGKLALLMQAYRQIDALPGPLASDVRGLVGMSLTQDEVFASGETVGGCWHVVGQRVSLDGRLRQHATWLTGANTGQYSLILNYAVGPAAFSETFVTGTAFNGNLSFWPSAAPLRALVRERRSSPEPFTALPDASSIETHLANVAKRLAGQPWSDRFPAALGDVIPVLSESGRWYVRDLHGCALPLSSGDHWTLLALSGGNAVDLFGEWDGKAIIPLAVAAEGAYYPLQGGGG